jgi:hypothetical protein
MIFAFNLGGKFFCLPVRYLLAFTFFIMTYSFAFP